MEKRKGRRLPRFKSEKEEREFWRTHDSADYLDFSAAEPAVFPNLKPRTRAISIRLPESLLSELRILANKRDVPYQSLVKIYLSERVTEERSLGKKRQPVSPRRRVRPPQPASRAKKASPSG